MYLLNNILIENIISRYVKEQYFETQFSGLFPNSVDNDLSAFRPPKLQLRKWDSCEAFMRL